VNVRATDASDIVAPMEHSHDGQVVAIDGGAMDGWGQVNNCTRSQGYPCISQFHCDQIPNICRLYENYAIDDRFFESNTLASFASHLEVAAATPDGFIGNNPGGQSDPGALGWGCNSGLQADFLEHDGSIGKEYSCVPDYNLDPSQYPYGGAAGPTNVPSVPTMMDNATAAGVSWRIYQDGTDGNGWSICPTFAGCLYTQEATNVVSNAQVYSDALSGHLPALSLVMPSRAMSQHNNQSMGLGDKWIGKVVTDLELSPQWAHMAVFLAWDDCGCFFDHVPPPAGTSMGIRVPVIAISPYAKAGYTGGTSDGTVANFDSITRYAEEMLGIPSLGQGDATAYDLQNLFDYSQDPAGRVVHMVRERVPGWELALIRARPQDPDDPT
jgi:phospholipase C